MEIKEEGASEEGQHFLPTPQANDTGDFQFTSIQKTPNEPQLEFILACRGLSRPARDRGRRPREPNALVQVSVAQPAAPGPTRYASTEVVEGTRDPLFLTGVTFPSEYPIYEETKIKLTVYDVKDKAHDTVQISVLPERQDPPPEAGRSFLGYASFTVGELLRSKEQLLALSLRTSDGGKVVGTIEVSVVKMGEIEDGEADHVTTDVQGQKCALVCECAAPDGGSGKENLPFLNAVLKNPVCKLYRFPTSDNKWMRIREQMSESILSFHIPKELISLHIKEDLCRNQELKELGELSPHWDNLRKNVLTHCDQMVNMYQDILTELSKETGSSFKSSSSKGEKTLEFVPINLHLQRMHVHSPHLKDALYDVITVGAPAAHFQGFKNGGLRKLLHRFEMERRNTGYQFIYYSPENTAKAKEVLSNINQLQPLIATHADLLLNSASQHSPDSLKNSLKMLSEKDRVWANVGKSLNCIIDMVDKLIARDGASEGGGGSSKDGEKDASPVDPITAHPKEDWYEQLCPLICALKDCMGEVVNRAKQSLAFVLLQELAAGLPQCLMLTLRRDVVFSQALAGLVCGFIIKLHTSLHDPGFLQQLHTVGLVVQYEGLLSTYSDEIGMLEDMAVGISDLKKVAFKIIEAKSNDVLPVITGRREHYVVEVKLPARMFEVLPPPVREGQLLHVHPVLFNVGINEQQTLADRFGDVSLQESINQENFELLKEYYAVFMEKMPPDYISHFQEQNDLKGLLENLHQNIQAKKRKNVEIMWLAATICRKLNGIRFTCCKSAKDRTSMSVTLEQCSILRDEHQLHKDFFIRALDCMRSRQTQGALSESDDPETGCLTDNKPTSRHFYPVALLLVSSHLLVVWLILSLALLLAKYQ
ncbi:inositol polyphosphate 4-phosphatase type II isoform X5 [Canis lupus dingo]|uniref:phosphatidylinositol-3,4-bisphosphate 4-phosphatase n=1 Tax=Canis lupus familiaris TaxID=9615 RepID=A0A8C0NLJ1_CANLF|nr:inositol polyphosphate 4-phosphatase type II isoform X5 [Canis lupus dingo]